MTKGKPQFHRPRIPYQIGPSRAATRFKVQVNPDLAPIFLELFAVIAGIAGNEFCEQFFFGLVSHGLRCLRSFDHRAQEVRAGNDTDTFAAGVNDCSRLISTDSGGDQLAQMGVFRQIPEPRQPNRHACFQNPQGVA